MKQLVVLMYGRAARAYPALTPQTGSNDVKPLSPNYSVALPSRKDERNLLWGFPVKDFLTMALLSGATYLVMRWCLWK